MSAVEIQEWWRRLGCGSRPSRVTADDYARDEEIGALRAALAASQQALQYEQRHAAELETALAAATAPQTVEKPFAHFVQPSGFGPFVECEPKQAGSFPAYRSAQAVAPAQVEQELVYSYCMKLADGSYDNWRDCSPEHAAHVASWPDGFKVRALYTRPQAALPAAQVVGLSEDQCAVIAEAVVVLESAAAYNRSMSRTVLAHTQQDRAERLSAILAAKSALADGGGV